MELASVQIDRPPSRPGRVRLVGDVIYGDRRAKPEQYWFEVPEAYADSLSLSGNPWLACLLPLAVTRREPLRLCLPVDPVLYANAARLMQIWAGWYRHLRAIPIDAEAKPALVGAVASETAAFFSGGVDSFFTVLRGRETRDRTAFPLIDRLLCVWGFDVGLDTPEEFERLRARLSEAARDLGKEFLDVATNLREVRFREADWGPHAHGCALASVGLALERRFPAIYIAATYTGGPPIRPWGSHPETDPLLSTSHTRIIHDGAGIGRWEKTEYISRSDVAMRSLHVCPRARSSENCGECRKCYLVLMMLEISGALSRCSAFRIHTVDPERIKRIFLKSPQYVHLFGDIEMRARAAGREEIAEAIAQCLSRTRRLKRLLMPDWMRTTRGLWRIASLWRKALLAHSIE